MKCSHLPFVLITAQSHSSTSIRKGIHMKATCIFLLLALCGGLRAQNVGPRTAGVEAALEQNGKPRGGINGSFDGQGYEMQYGRNGESVFKKTNSLHKTQTIAWSALGVGVDNTVWAIAVSGSNVYIAGVFISAGGNSAIHIATWNGIAWSALGSGMNGAVRAVAVSGSDVYAGGDFITADGTSAQRIAKWNGSAWSALGTGLNSSVRAIAVSGSDVYVAGDFTTAGGNSANYVAKWNGSVWSALGTGLDNIVLAIAVNGNDVYVGGLFTTAGGNPASYVAKWNGSTWSALGSGLNARPAAIAVNSSDVYVGGVFTTAGGNPANCIAKWNGSTWSALASGVNNDVNAIAVSGSDVYAGGVFTTADGNPASRIAKWNGSAWSALGSGTNSGVTSMAVSPNAGAMMVGGLFTTADGTTVNRIAQFTDSNNPLPVQMTFFTVTADRFDAELRWSTATETNTNGFEIERREVNSQFTRIGVVVGAGTSSSPREYTFADRGIPAGRYAYRIKQIDKDGSFKYTQTDEVEVGLAPKAFTLSQNYPNPFNPSTMLEFTFEQNGNATVKIYNMLGQEVATVFNQKAEAGRIYQAQFYASRFTSGVYVSVLESGGKRLLRKMLLVK
jgi:hypothetical protein